MMGLSGFGRCPSESRGLHKDFDGSPSGCTVLHPGGLCPGDLCLGGFVQGVSVWKVSTQRVYVQGDYEGKTESNIIQKPSCGQTDTCKINYLTPNSFAVITVKEFKPATPCVTDQDATTVSKDTCGRQDLRSTPMYASVFY